MNLHLLAAENFDPCNFYDCIYIEEPYGFVWDSDDIQWISRDVAKSHSVFRVEMSVFEEFNALFSSFDFYDGYGITDFTGEHDKRLSELFLEEKTNVLAYSDDAFKKRFKYLFELIHDEDFLVAFDAKNEITLVRQDIITIIDAFIYYLNKTVAENKSFTIVGI